jgi:hypothetical protein
MEDFGDLDSESQLEKVQMGVGREKLETGYRHIIHGGKKQE